MDGLTRQTSTTERILAALPEALRDTEFVGSGTDNWESASADGMSFRSPVSRWARYEHWTGSETWALEWVAVGGKRPPARITPNQLADLGGTLTRLEVIVPS